ncbi:hypothetical protein [uncultured Dysosmobacter sp.]|uniref:hypothetical protein n=1 Tax=uncultured Dysosmobacter sp. TaxID=2591384 RepID=UPI00262F9E89|nr:hypothetical protein [uncultured Dysosmobacter sp.]
MSKVRMGCKYPRFAAIAAETPTTRPTYDSKITDIGEAIAANLTINYATGELYSNDALNIKAEEFASGTIAMETDGLESEVYAALFGAKLDAESKEVSHSAEDVAPCGGLGYYTRMMDKTKKVYYEGHYFPKVQATLSGANASTKSGSINFTTASVNFTVMRCGSGEFWVHEVFETEAAAKSWVDGCLSPAVSG